MKWFVKLLSIVCLLALVIPNGALAESVSSYEENIIYFEDGSYITVELVQYGSRALNMTTGSKNYVYRNSSGERILYALRFFFCPGGDRPFSAPWQQY